MFPIRDHNPSNRTPFVTYALMAINIAVFLSYWPMMTDGRALAAFFGTWAMIPAEVSSGGGWHTVVTSMFLHGGWMHIIGNMLFLWIFGDNLEDEMGHLGFLAFYMASGIGAALAHVAAAPLSPVPTVGASGAIAGVMGGYLLLFPRARVDVLVIIVFFIRIFSVPAWAMLGLWFALQLFNGVGADMNGGGVAYWAHAGGFVIGIALTLPLFLRLGGPRFWRRTEGHPPHPDAKYALQRSNIPTVRRRR
ncbi:Membrane associated serine protease, rhomboid family [Lutimaribacter pacificus]|uniref:Membrane associated serine protease, rhomboid family n=1 Tax=Lutimaribacter pacificus TaxID=391948 RepID=A0A1H0JM50_9RHOB|nr:rhomboid family intramembrane serine protease [Lutimaribacter pacificus]SDO44786.1 Membrane associated serine protease, rhomboid family [Lutimaribacter pacificus]SHK08642.1 Membrane associated serine protease, rhomboid family [Lutimaribacter pacificus]